MPRYTVATPAYLKKHGTPTHPTQLAQHKCFGYAYLSASLALHNAAGEQAWCDPGQLRVNNGEAVVASLLAGLGIADLPEFIVGDALASEKSKSSSRAGDSPTAPCIWSCRPAGRARCASRCWRISCASGSRRGAGRKRR